jgi:sterol desaturase/sphingolipid hydroxylase (fatty acid hydroxylase superfamily)
MIMIILTGLVAGALAWTLLEFIIHYPLGHWPKGRILISREHLKHHSDTQYFTPLATKLRGIVPVLALPGLALWHTVGAVFAVSFVVSLTIGWVTYEWLHQSIHVNGPRSAYGRWAARHHLYHHFMRPNANHGVTTPIWDFILRTHQPAVQIRIREKDLADLPWLAKALESENPPAFVADYVIHQGKRPASG